ncbi:GGDEF domain-containing protein [Vibrio sp. SCSIO 43136]|nr:GGDEF domain-containing protein [Vibrio sp. SCSIO 43136]
MSYTQKFVLGLIAITTAVLISFYRYGANKSIDITPEHYGYSVADDRPQKGATTSTLNASNQLTQLNCDLKASEYPWPYCSLSILVGDLEGNGLDLNDFHTLYLNIDYQAPNPDARLRVYLKNFNSAYSEIGNDYTLKYNGLEYSPGSDAGVIAIPLDNFQVLTWWLADHNIPIEFSGPERGNVIALEVATGNSAALGVHDIKIHSIRLEGNLVTGEELLFTLLAIWLTLAFCFVIIDNRKVREQANQALERQNHLQKVNRKLRIENTEVLEMAHRDALTGARNRHAVREWLARQTELSNQEKRPFSVIYLDIDLFKSINDKFGHKVGDDILKEFVLIVSSAIDSQDHLVRWGGEEFIVFCPDTNLEGASDRAHTIVSRVEQHIWMHGEVLTCSAGVAMMNQERATETIARADEALYLAKQNGRNRVEVSVTEL